MGEKQVKKSSKAAAAEKPKVRKLKKFEDGQRVRVLEDESSNILRGKVGTVVRLRTNGSAFVNMDEDIPSQLRSFEPPDPRANHVILFADECEAVDE